MLDQLLDPRLLIFDLLYDQSHIVSRNIWVVKSSLIYLLCNNSGRVITVLVYFTIQLSKFVDIMFEFLR
jgi:hypothetical protein